MKLFMHGKMKRDFILLSLWGLYIILTVTIFWRNNTLTGTLVVLGSAGLLFSWRSLKNFAIFFVAGLLGFTCEYIFTAKMHYYHYNNPSTIILSRAFTITTFPWWLFFVWGYIIIIFIHLAYLMEEVIRSLTSGKHVSIRKIFMVPLWIIMIVYFILVYKEVNFDFTKWFIIPIVFMIILWHRDVDIILFFVSAIFGTLGEWVCIQNGVWTHNFHYSYYGFMEGLPLSLPLVWGSLTVLLSRLPTLFVKGAIGLFPGKQKSG